MNPAPVPTACYTCARSPIGPVLACLALAWLTACTPWQTVHPVPGFITLAVQPGDTVKVKTLDGRKAQFQVTEMSESHLGGEPPVQFAFDEILELKLQSREEPPVPCGGQEPLGCSIPTRGKMAASTISAIEVYAGIYLGIGEHAFRDTFHYACVLHDFCYRHGFRTYGHSREACDDEFKSDMLRACSIDPGCRSAAAAFYAAVRKEGGESYQAETSTWCEYDGSGLTISTSPEH